VTVSPESLVALTEKSAAVGFLSLKAAKVIACNLRETNVRVTDVAAA
jgi:hypothetical protein